MQVPLQTCIVGIVIVSSLVALMFSAVATNSEIGSSGRVVNSNGDRYASSIFIAEKRAVGVLLSHLPAFAGSVRTHYEIELKNHSVFKNHTVLFMWEALTPLTAETPILGFGDKYVLATPLKIIFRVGNQTVSVHRDVSARLRIRTSKNGPLHLLFINNLEVARVYEQQWVARNIITLNYSSKLPSGGHVMYNDVQVYGHN